MIIPCNQCKYVATSASSLKIHGKNIFEGVWYHSDKCEYHESTNLLLKEHIESVHEGLIYPNIF